MKQNNDINGITPLQNYSSAKTSLPSNEPKGFKLIDWQKGTVNLDLGGGKTTFGTDYLKAKGVKNLIFDFNYPAEHNKEIAEYVRKNKVDTVTCFNVLNVLDTDAAIENMCLMAAKALKSDGTAYFQVYNKGSKGVSQNNQSFQQGEPLSFYVPFVEKYFDDVRKKGDLIIASKPKKTSKKSQWQFAFDSNEGILFGVLSGLYTNEIVDSIDKKIKGGIGEDMSISEIIAKYNCYITKYPTKKGIGYALVFLYYREHQGIKINVIPLNFEITQNIYRILKNKYNIQTNPVAEVLWTYWIKEFIRYNNTKRSALDDDTKYNYLVYNIMGYWQDKLLNDDENHPHVLHQYTKNTTEKEYINDINAYDVLINHSDLQKLELQLLSNEIIPDHNELKERIDVLKNRLAKRITQRPRLFINKQAYQRWQAYTRKMQKQIDKLESLLRIESLTKNFSEDKFGMNTSINEVLSGLGALVYHNSPFLLKKADGSFIDPITKEKLGFDHRFMGKGEGSQVHGWGSYFSVEDLRSYGHPKSMYYYDGELLQNIISEAAYNILMLNDFELNSAIGEVMYRIERLKPLGSNYYDKILSELKSLKQSKIIEKRESHNYVVKIPDNDGFNYLEEDKPIKPKQLAKIVSYLNKKDKKTGDYFKTLKGTLCSNIYYELTLVYKTKEMASKFLKKCGIVGIHYFGKTDGECYVIFDENDAKIVKHELFGLGSLISEPTKQTFYENLYSQLESIVKDDSFEKNGIRNFILSHIPEDYKNDDIEGIVEVFYQRLRALKCGGNNELSGLGDIELDTTDYDSKHINNLAPGKNIPESIIENLNKNGMTVENIEKLQDSGFPVCKYKTQITVHGNCPELKSNYVGYYSCLVKNQNNSLGIKWNGIDTEKKERIIKLALDVRSIFKNKEHIITKNGEGYYINNCWNRYWNSTVTYLWQAVTITEGERRYSWQLTQTDKDNINAIAKKISEKLKGLFFGYIEVHYPVIKITILGIYEKNMDKFCQAVFDYTQSEIKELYDEHEKLAHEKWQLQQLQRKKAEKERNEYFEEWKKQNPIPENFVPISRYPVKGDIIAEYWGKDTGVSLAKDGGYYFDKERFKPKIVFQKFYNSFGKLCYRRCDKDGNFTERHGDEFKGEYPKDWYLKTNAVTKPKPPEKKPETPTVTTTPGGNSYNLQIVDYSEKGVVLTGDTKPIKDEIKALGGKFGMRFDTSKVPSGVGWIFPKTKLAEIEKLVAKYSTKGGNIETDKALQMLELQLVSDSGLGCLKLDTLSGLTPINKLKRINQIKQLPNETDII